MHPTVCFRIVLELCGLRDITERSNLCYRLKCSTGTGMLDYPYLGRNYLSATCSDFRSIDVNSNRPFEVSTIQIGAKDLLMWPFSVITSFETQDLDWDFNWFLVFYVAYMHL
jgi:hypothetical protein